MSNYTLSDTSTHDAAPVEAFKFIGSLTTYRYTSNDEQITVNGEDYDPLIGLVRKSAKAGTQEESKLDLTIEMPFDTDIVQDYAFAQSPARLTVEIRRVHRQDDPAADFILFWKGRVTSFSVKGKIATLRVPSIFATALEGNIPNQFYQRPCNHVLFDARCKAVRASHNVTASVVDVGSLNIEVDNDGFADGVLAGGEIVHNSSGERRLILNNQVNLITINHPFSATIEVSDQVELTKGCDHKFSTCKTKFSNEENFGGFPFIPGENPFVGSIG